MNFRFPLFGIPNERAPKFIYLVSSVIIFLYVLIRAVYLDFTYDEAWTLIDFVPQSIIHILNFTPCSANNHILNSLSIKFLYSFLPETIFVARIPNVLAFLIFLYFSYRICSSFLSNFVGVFSFLIIILNPFALDFFGLARGYGLSLACEMASLFYLLIYIKEGSARAANFSFLWAYLTVMSSLSTLNYFLGLLFCFALHTLLFRRELSLRNFLTGIIASIVLTLSIWEPVRKLIETDNLYYGGESGFVEDTLKSLGKYSMYSQQDSGFINYCIYIFLVVFVCIVLFDLRRANKFKSYAFITFCILFISSLAVILQHYLLGSLYLIDRTALFFYPLFILPLCFSLENLERPKFKKSVILILGIIFIMNFFTHANFSKTVTWYFDAHTSQMLTRINEEGKRLNKVQKIDYSWPFESGVHFYLKYNNYPFIEIVKTGYIEVNAECDYYMYLGGTLDKIGYKPEEQFIVKEPKDTILRFDDEKVFLFRRKPL